MPNQKTSCVAAETVCLDECFDFFNIKNVNVLTFGFEVEVSLVVKYMPWHLVIVSFNP